MGKNLKSLKNWWRVTRPSKVILFFQWLTAVIPSAMTVLGAIPAAEAISCLTVANYKWAMIYLALAFGCEVISIISWEIEYRIDAAQLGRIYPRIQEQLFKKVFSAEDANFKYTSKEKMVNVITLNIVTLSDFCDYLAYKSAYLVEAIVTLVIIFTTNVYVGLLIFGIAIIVYFLISVLNAAVGRQSMAIQSERDSLTETFADIVDGRKLSTDLNIKDNLHNKYFGKVDGLMKHYKKRKNLKSVRDNWVYLLYTGIIMLCSVYLVSLVKADAITTTLYLIVTPYLTSAITKFVDFFSVLANLEDANIAALRVKTLLDMSEQDIIEFGKNSTDKINGAITFTNVKYSSSGKLDNSLGEIKMFNTQIKKGEVVLFEGVRNCGKRALFYMLRRAARPDTGTITFDTINIYDFDAETYKHNISYVTNKPYFFNDTIIENLKYVEKNKKKIIEACKKVGIDEVISALPNGYDTNLSQNQSALSAKDKFLLGLARALLTKSEIFMVYEFPVGLNESEQKTIKNVLNKLREERTILIFCATNPVSDIIDRHFLFEKGVITEQKVETRNRTLRSGKKDTFSSVPTSYFEGKLSKK